jgi:hypothetical protein
MVDKRQQVNSNLADAVFSENLFAREYIKYLSETENKPIDNYNYFTNPEKTTGGNKDWDVFLTDLSTNKKTTFEVKYDIRCAGRFDLDPSNVYTKPPTGNVCIEYIHANGKTKSGISATKADYWVQMFENIIYILEVPYLKELLKKTPYIWHNKNAMSEEGNTLNFLIEKEKFCSAVYKAQDIGKGMFLIVE